MADDATRTEVLDGNGVATPESQSPATTAPETSQAPVAPDLSAYDKRIAALEKELKQSHQGLSPDEITRIADMVVKHPSQRQRTQDMVRVQIKAERDAEIERLTEPIQKLVDSDELDPKVAKKSFQEIRDAVKTKYDEKLKTALSEGELAPSQATPPQASPAANQADWQRQQVQNMAQAILNRAGMSWTDVEKELSDYARTNGTGMPPEEFAALVAEKRGARRATEIAAEQVKAKEQAELKTRQADRQGATAPPPTGPSAMNKREQILKKFRNSGKLGDAFLALGEAGED